MCGGSAWKSRSSSAGSASVKPLCDRLSSCIALAILRHQPLVLDSYPHSGSNLQGELPDHQGLRGDNLEAFALEQLDADLIVVPEATPDGPRLALGDVGQGPLDQAGPKLSRLGRRHQAERMRSAAAARHQAHPPNHLHPLDDKARLSRAARDPCAPRAGLEAPTPFGKIRRFHRRDALGRGRHIKKVEAELVVTSHRPPPGHGRGRSSSHRLGEQAVKPRARKRSITGSSTGTRTTNFVTPWFKPSLKRWSSSAVPSCTRSSAGLKQRLRICQTPGPSAAVSACTKPSIV